MIIQDGMSINIRTKEEWQVFCEVGAKEGIVWDSGTSLAEYSRDFHNHSIQIGYFTPHKATYAELNWTDDECLNLVEAADLFRNYLISRRLKQ